MFIFTTNQDLWAHELINHIMSYDHFLDRNDMLKFILLFYDPIYFLETQYKPKYSYMYEYSPLWTHIRTPYLYEYLQKNEPAGSWDPRSRSSRAHHGRWGCHLPLKE
jgi:hypothetical protein